MLVRSKARNALRSLMQAYGTPAAKRRLWNAEFGSGRWKCLDSTAGDCIYPYLEKYSRQGHILDLGCGSGSTANELAASTYATYVGVDISDVALQQARVRSEQTGRAAKTWFYQSDIASYAPDRQFDVILFRDSLYYVPRHNTAPTLHRYAQHLSRTGVFIVRIANGDEKYGALIALIERHFRIIETGHFADPDAVVLVFAP